MECAGIGVLRVDASEPAFGSPMSRASSPPLRESVSRAISDAESCREEQERFERDGFLVVRGLAEPDLVARLRAVTSEDVARVAEPVEFEAEVGYPGAPRGLDAVGGRTVRRLKQALVRDPAFLEWAAHPGVLSRLRRLIGPDLVLPLAHHNCVMTKQPRHSSDTGWHRDIRYWTFARPELVNAWLALGPEREENGGLKVLAGSHRWKLPDDRFDAARFLREDLPENAPLLASQVQVDLDAGDVLFFHCLTFHAASRNRTESPKFSVVFTYRAADNPPLPGTRSSAHPELLLPPSP